MELINLKAQMWSNMVERAGADSGFLEMGFKFTKGVRFVSFKQLFK